MATQSRRRSAPLPEFEEVQCEQYEEIFEELSALYAPAVALAGMTGKGSHRISHPVRKVHDYGCPTAQDTATSDYANQDSIPGHARLAERVWHPRKASGGCAAHDPAAADHGAVNERPATSKQHRGGQYRFQDRLKVRIFVPFHVPGAARMLETSLEILTTKVTVRAD